MSNILQALDAALGGQNVTPEQLTAIAKTLGVAKTLNRDSVKTLSLTQAEIDGLWKSVESYSRDAARGHARAVEQSIAAGDLSELQNVTSKSSTMADFEAKRVLLKNSIRAKCAAAAPVAVELATAFSDVCATEASKVESEDATLRSKFSMPAGQSQIGSFLREAGRAAIALADRKFPVSPKDRVPWLAL